MSTSSPGRYAEHNFAKNIYNIRAIEGENPDIAIKKIEPDRWEISGIKNSAVISYTLYANHADGTYSGIDADFANLNMPSSLLWIKDMESYPAKVTFHMPDSNTWKIATQLIVMDSAKNIYAAPDLQYLMDSPCIIAGFKLRKLDKSLNDGYHIQMAISTDAAEEEIDLFSSMTQKVLNEQRMIYDEFPEYMDSRTVQVVLRAINNRWHYLIETIL